MKQVTQQEFEKMIQSLIKGEITRKKLAKVLQTDIRTLNNRIRKLSEENPELYEEYIKTFPYKPKSRDNIDVEALVIEVMKRKKCLSDISKKYDIAIRTITRKIKELEKTNPELVKIYREYAYYIKTGQIIPIDIQEKIENLSEKTVVLSGIAEKREEKLRKTIEEFEELVSTGMSKDEAAKKLGYAGHAVIWKMKQELRIIETENASKKGTQENKTKSFRDSMKVSVMDLRSSCETSSTVKEEEIVEEGR